MKISKLLKRMSAVAMTLMIGMAVAYLVADTEKKTLNDKTRSTLPGQFVRLSKGVTHYELGGPEDAPVVVLVHGFSVPYYVWDPTFEALVEAGFRVLRYDLYGRGYSDRPEAEYDLDLLHEQLYELLSALKIDGPVSLVGLSFGGPVVARFANDHPEKIRSLVLFAPQAAPVSVREIFPMNLPLVGEYFMAVYVVPVMLPKTQSSDFYDPELFSDWEDRYRVQMEYEGFRRAILSTIRNTVETDAILEYKSLGAKEIPVALFWGQQDQTVSLADIALIQEAIPKLDFHPVDKAGHLLHYERPEVVNPLLINFLSGKTMSD